MEKFGTDPALLNLKDRMEETPLMHAAKNNNIDVAIYLCHHGAHVGTRNYQGFTASHFAAACGNPELLRIFHNHKDPLITRNILGWTPLHYALKYNHPETVDYLLSIEAIDKEIEDNNTDLLHLAASVNSERVVQTLLELGEPANGDNHNHWTFLTFAASNGHTNLMRAMKPIISSDMWTNIDRVKRNLAHLAVIGGHLDVLQLLEEFQFDVFDAVDQYHKGLVHYAAEMGRHTLLDYLAEKTDINTRDKDGNTPLHLAAATGKYECVKRLLEFENIEFDVKNKYDQTPMFLAVSKWNNDIAMLLLKKGADLNTCCNGKPLISAAVCFKNCEMVAQLCATDGVDVFKTDLNRWSPVHFAAQLGSVDDLMLFESISHDDLFAKTKANQTPLDIAIIWNQMDVVAYYSRIPETDYGNKDVDGNTALHHAIRRGRVTIFRALLQVGIDKANIRNNKGQTPLHVAIETWQTDIAAEMVRSGACNLGVKDNKGRTPFLLAIALAQTSTVTMFLTNDISIDVDDAGVDGNTAVHLAANLQRSEILEILRKSERFSFDLENNNGQTPWDIAAENNGACLRYLNKLSRKNIKGKFGNSEEEEEETVNEVEEEEELKETHEEEESKETPEEEEESKETHEEEENPNEVHEEEESAMIAEEEETLNEAREEEESKETPEEEEESKETHEEESNERQKEDESQKPHEGEESKETREEEESKETYEDEASPNEPHEEAESTADHEEASLPETPLESP